VQEQKHSRCLLERGLSNVPYNGCEGTRHFTVTTIVICWSTSTGYGKRLGAESDLIKGSRSSATGIRKQIQWRPKSSAWLTPASRFIFRVSDNVSIYTSSGVLRFITDCPIGGCISTLLDRFSQSTKVFLHLLLYMLTDKLQPTFAWHQCHCCSFRHKHRSRRTSACAVAQCRVQ
jgi:hypothetical protein